MSKTLKTRITQKFDTVANWQQSSLVLLKGELAIDNLNRIKIGDGLKTWSEITTFAVDPSAVKPAVQATSTLPEPTSQDLVPGNLVLTEDGKLWCLVETPADDPQDPAERSWVDLTNNSEIASLRSDVSALESGLVALKNADEAHEAALVALQATIGSSLESELDSIRDAVAANAGYIAENRADLDSILDSNGKINSSVLPSFVDDVVEGLVCLGSDNSEATYRLTHNGDSVVGFFAAAGDDTDSVREMKFVAAAPASESEDLGITTHPENGVTYKFPQNPSVDWMAPSTSTIYVDVKTNKTYRWSGSQFVVVASDLALGNTSFTAFAGSRGVALENDVEGIKNEINDTTDDTTGETVLGLKSRVAALESADTAHEASLAVLGQQIENAISAADARHQEIEGEIASSIVALKEESEEADRAHEAAIAVLQQQISGVTFSDVMDNSGNILNDEVILIDCGGAGE